MSEIVYNGVNVDFGVEGIRTESEAYSTASQDIEASTSELVSAKGFAQYVGGVSSGTYSAYVDNCKEECSKLADQIRKVQLTIMKYGEGEEYISSFLNSMTEDEWNRLTGTNITTREDFAAYLKTSEYDLSSTLIGLGKEDNATWLGKAGRWLKTLGLGAAEGFLEFGETLYDAGTLLVGGVKSLFASDKASADAIMEETRAKVEKQWAASVVDNWIETADCLADVREYKELHPESYQKTRGFGKMAGYATATLLTAKGLGTVAGLGAKALGMSAVGSQVVTTGTVALNAGVLGFSSGTEEAWVNGASTSTGLKVGAATGAWEAAQWGFGAGLNQATQGATHGAVTRIVADGLTGTVEGLVVDPGKNLILHEGDEAYNWSQAYQDAGGTSNVVQKTVVAAGTSAINEGMDAIKAAKNIQKIKNVDAAAQKTMAENPTTTKTNALGQETKIWEVKNADGDITQKIVQGPTGKTTEFDYEYKTDIFGNKTRTTSQRTFDANTSSTTGLYKSKVEKYSSDGNLTSAKAYNADGTIKYRQTVETDGGTNKTTTSFADGREVTKNVTQNGNKTDVVTTTKYKDGTTSTNKLSELTIDVNGKQIRTKEIEITNKNGGTTNTRLTEGLENGRRIATTLSATKNNGQVGDGVYNSKVTYDSNGTVETKNISTAKQVYGSDGKAVTQNNSPLIKNAETTVKYENKNGELVKETSVKDVKTGTIDTTVKKATPDGIKTVQQYRILPASQAATNSAAGNNAGGNNAGGNNTGGNNAGGNNAGGNNAGGNNAGGNNAGGNNTVGNNAGGNNAGGNNAGGNNTVGNNTVGNNAGGNNAGGNNTVGNNAGGNNAGGNNAGGNNTVGNNTVGNNAGGNNAGGNNTGGNNTGGNNAGGNNAGGNNNLATRVTTKTDVLGGETMIREQIDPQTNEVLQKIVTGPTGKTTEINYQYTTDPQTGITVKTTTSQTYGGTNDIATHVSKVETIQNGTVVKKEVYDVDGTTLKYKQDISTNGNTTVTKTTDANGNAMSTRKVTETTANGKTIKEIEVNDAGGGVTKTRMVDELDSNGNKVATSVESVKKGYQGKADSSTTSTMTYDANGHVESKDISTTKVKLDKNGNPVTKNGKTVYEETRKSVDYKKDAAGDVRKVTADFGAKKKDISVEIKQRASANSDVTVSGKKSYKDLNIAEKNYVNSKTHIDDSVKGKGAAAATTALGREELADKYTRQLALEKGEITPEIKAQAEKMADSTLGIKNPVKSYQTGKNVSKADGKAAGIEKLIDNPLSKKDTIINGALAVGKTALKGSAYAMGGLTGLSVVGNMLGGIGSNNYPTTDPTVTDPTITTDPTTPTNPTYPSYPSGGGGGGGGGGYDGGGSTPTPTPTPTPTEPADTTDTLTPDEIIDILPTETTPTETPIVDNTGNNYTGGGQSWGTTGDGTSMDEPADGDLSDEDLSDEDLLLGDEDLEDLEDEDSVYTIPMTVEDTTKKSTKSSSKAVPILVGLGLAAAAGVGAKIYMDNKKNNDNGEDDEFSDDDDEFMTDSEYDELNSTDSDLIADEWSGEDDTTSSADEESLDYERPSFYSDTLGDEI